MPSTRVRASWSSSSVKYRKSSAGFSSGSALFSQRRPRLLGLGMFAGHRDAELRPPVAQSLRVVGERHLVEVETSGRDPRGPGRDARRARRRCPSRSSPGSGRASPTRSPTPVVEQVLADPRQVVHDRYAEVLQVRLRPDAGVQQQTGRVDGARTQHDLAPARTRTSSPAAVRTCTPCARVPSSQVRPGLSMSSDGALVHHGVQIGHGRRRRLLSSGWYARSKKRRPR